MHTSGISVTPDLTEAFAVAESDPAIGFFSVNISRDATFVALGTGLATGSFESDLIAVAATLQPKTPVYVMLRTVVGKWLLIFYCPDNSPVRSKMLFASSLSSLKEGLGGPKFTKWDFPIDSPAECNIAEYERSAAAGGESVMTYDEKHKHDAHKHTSTMSEVEVAAIVNVPINVDDAALTAIKGLAAGSHTTCIFLLNKAEVLELAEPPSDLSLDDVSAQKLPPNEPRFVLHTLKHENDGEDTIANIFVYYCPGKAHPKLRMFYSTVKANVRTVFEALGVVKAKNIECSEPQEVSIVLALKELYPETEEKAKFAKPKARASAKARAPRPVFNANA